MDDPKIGDTPGWPAFRLRASAVESPLQSAPIRAEQAIWSTVKRGKTARRALREVEFVAYISRRPIILGNGLMQVFSVPQTRRLMVLLSSLATLLSFFVSAAYAANIGTVVPVLGTVADLIYDSARNLVYLANASRNEVDIYSVGERRLVGSIATGTLPSSLALSPDLTTLYVASAGSNTINTINLNSRQRGNDYNIGSRPDAVAVGNDGKVVILGTGGLQRLDTTTGSVSPVPVSPPPTPPNGLQNIPPVFINTSAFASLVTTASGNLIIGRSLPNAGGGAANRLFVYEVASGVVLRSRNVTGVASILSASSDGSRFMAGPLLFDTQTLTILGRTGNVLNAASGGSAFSVDGNSVYASFNNGAACCAQTPINPLNPNNPQNPATPGVTIPGGGGFPGGGIFPGAPGAAQSQQTAAVLQILRSSSLTPQLGLRLSEQITSKIIASPDGQNLFATSTSGLMVIPIGQLNNVPILDVSSTNVVLSRDMCNRTIATATVQIRNIGGGRMTFAASVNSTSPTVTTPVILSQRSGIAPATLTISFDPRTVAVRGTSQYVVVLVSPEAVNIEPAILVNFNFRDVSDRGTIVPVNGLGVDMQMDSGRQRLYIANYTLGQVEVFSLESQTFLSPIRVGNRPLSMVMVNPSTLVVANFGSENFSVVDLDAMQEVDQISMGPIPLSTIVPLFPRYIAASSNAILFSVSPLPAAGVLPGNGQIWQLSLLTRSAFPRLDLGVGATNAIGGRNVLTAAADGSGILIADAGITQNANLRLYDPISDTFPILRFAAVPQFRGVAAAGSDGSSYVVENAVFNSVLGSQGFLASAAGLPIGQAASANAFGVAVANNIAVRVQSGTPQSLQRFNLATFQQDIQVSLPEQVMDITPAQSGANAALGAAPRQWPPRVTALEIGVNNQTQILPHGVIFDGNNNVYLLSWSGLTVVSLAQTGGRAPSFQASGVVNTSTHSRQISPGSLISILGSNLADAASAPGIPLPRLLGGVCVTANEMAIPLINTSPTQIDAQLPPELATTRVTLTVRSQRLGLVSPGVSIPVSLSSPGAFSLDVNGVKTAAIIHGADFALVTPDYPAERDETLILYAAGLGPVDPGVAAGEAASADPFSVTRESIQVTIGGHPYPVLWSGLAPGMVGIYQINLYVPGDRTEGDDLPVVITAGGAASATDDAPLTAVH